jgi:hypothetical protein
MIAPSARLLEGFCPDPRHGRLRVWELEGYCPDCEALWRPEFDADGCFVAIRLTAGGAEIRADLGSLDRGLPISDYVAYARRQPGA